MYIHKHFYTYHELNAKMDRILNHRHRRQTGILIQTVESVKPWTHYCHIYSIYTIFYLYAVTLLFKTIMAIRNTLMENIYRLSNYQRHPASWTDWCLSSHKKVEHTTGRPDCWGYVWGKFSELSSHKVVTFYASTITLGHKTLTAPTNIKWKR